MKLAVATIHCPVDSRRMDWVARQGQALKKVEWLVSEDYCRRGVWWNFQQAARRLATTDATHACFLQDDVVLCQHFVEGCHALLELKPDQLICGFHMRPKIAAMCEERRTAWYVDPDGVSTVALLCPMEFVRSFLAWQERHVLDDYPHDDRRWSMWVRWAEESPGQVWGVAQSLVQHAGVGRSLMGHNSPRSVAPRFCKDARRVDWSEGINNPYKSSSTSNVKKNLLPYYLP